MSDTKENEAGRDILQTALYAAEELYVAESEDEPTH